MTTTDFLGREYEEAYARLFNGAVIGGLQDGGRDVAVPGFGFVQVKASLAGARAFLAESLKRERFIPLCIGEPGAAEETLKSLKLNGVWIGKEIPNRAEVLASVCKVKRLCEAA